MKPRHATLLLLLAAQFALAACFVTADAPVPQLVLPAKIISVGDGDTVTLDVTIRMNVRLIGAWAPELTGEQREAGLKSKAVLKSMIDGKEGLLTVPLGATLGQSISLGRVLGRLNVDGKDMSDEMVRRGAATKEKQR